MACQHVRHSRQCPFGIERPKLLRQEFEFASAHEAAGGHRAPIGVHIGKRVASRIEAVETSADCEVDDPCARRDDAEGRSEEHTSELQSLMRTSYAVFCLKKKKRKKNTRQ